MSQQNDSYHLLLKYLPDAFARHKLIMNDTSKPVDYEFIDVNSVFEEMTGLKKEKVIGKKVSELFPTIKSLRFDWIDTFGRVTLTGEGIRFVQYFQPLKRWYDITAYSDEAGYFVTIFRDITAIRQQDNKMVSKFSEDGKVSAIGTRDITVQNQTEEKLRKSEEKYRTLVENLNEIVYILDEKANITYVSPSIHSVSGYSPSEVIGMKYYDLSHPDDREARIKQFRKILTGVNEVTESPFIAKNGEVIWLRTAARPVIIEGRVVGVQGVLTDITEKKRLEKSLQENLNRLNALLVNNPNLIAIFDKHERYVEVSAAAADIIGLPPEEIKGKTFAELLLPEVVSEFRQTIAELQAKQQVINKIDTIQVNDERRVFESWIFPIETKESEIELFGSIAVDITNRKKVEENLKQSEEEKSLILNVISERITFLDANYRIIWANRIAAESVGMKIEELTGRLCYELWYQRQEPCPGCPIKKVYETKTPQVGEVTTPGGRCWYMRGYPVINHEQKLTGIIKVAQDITEQKSKERDLKESEQRFRKLVELAPDAIFVQIERKFSYVNQAAVDLFGAESKEQLIGKPVMERFHPDYHQAVLKRIKKLNRDKQPLPWLEQVYLKLDGTPVYVEVSAVPIRFQLKDGALVYVRDITERKRQERQKLNEQALLRQQQKLEAIGVLASGVAHEINNPINGIINYGQLILDDEPPGSSNAEYASEIIDECERISSIVRNLLQFARHEKHSHSPAKVEDIVQKTLSLIGTVIRKDQISLEVNISEGLPSLKCRSQQIQQVLMNLLTNARDALNSKYPGYHEDKKIKIESYAVTKDNRCWIRIAVEDYGTGIPESIQDKLFEPFFTTKTREQGTGLGLSITYGIIKDHQGDISFETKPGSCTRFYIDLPVDNGWELEHRISYGQD